VAGEIPASMLASLKAITPMYISGCASMRESVSDKQGATSYKGWTVPQCWTVWYLCGRQQTELCCGRAAQAYKFERMQPLSYYASAEQRAATAYGGLFWRGDPQQESLAARCRMLRYTYSMTRCETSIITPLTEAQQGYCFRLLLQRVVCSVYACCRCTARDAAAGQLSCIIT